MDKKTLIRVWEEVDISQIEPHLLIAGSTVGDCGKCKEVGISFDSKTCPKCGTSFRFMATRLAASPREAKRLRSKRPDLLTIDFNDFKEAQARNKARGFLGE